MAQEHLTYGKSGSPGRTGHGRRILLSLSVAGLVWGCDTSTDLRRPRHAHVHLSGVASRVEMTTAQRFLLTAGTLQLIEPAVDTVAPPFARTYPLGAPARFYVQTRNLHPSPAVVRLRVRIDERTWYDEERLLAPGEMLEFLYRYDEPGIR